MPEQEEFNTMWQAYLGNELPEGAYFEFIQCINSGKYDEIIKRKIGELLYATKEGMALSPEIIWSILARIKSGGRQ